MSWDLLAMSFPPEIRELSELPDSFKGTPVGQTVEIVNAILEFPGARVSGQGMVTIERESFAIEISVGEETICTCIMFFVYGDGSVATKVLQQLGARLSVRIWDINGSQFLDCASDPTQGFKIYKAYRDQVMPKDAGRDEKG